MENSWCCYLFLLLAGLLKVRESLSHGDLVLFNLKLEPVVSVKEGGFLGSVLSSRSFDHAKCSRELGLTLRDLGLQGLDASLGLSYLRFKCCRGILGLTLLETGAGLRFSDKMFKLNNLCAKESINH